VCTGPDKERLDKATPHPLEEKRETGRGGKGENTSDTKKLDFQAF